MTDKLQKKDMEKNLVYQLSKSSLDKKPLSSISKSIAALHRTGYQVIDCSISQQTCRVLL